MSCYSTFWPNPSKDQGPKSPAARDEGLSQAPGVSAASWAQESGLQRRARRAQPACPRDRGQEKVTLPRVCPLFCCRQTREALGSWRSRLSVHGGHLAVMQAELLGLETETGDAVGHVDPRGRGA